MLLYSMNVLENENVITNKLYGMTMLVLIIDIFFEIFQN